MDPSITAKLAQRRYLEASQWWAVVDGSIHRYRCWVMLFLARKAVRRRQGRNAGRRIKELIDQAHDFLVMESDNINVGARCAISAEIAGKIYDEELDGRESSGLV